MSSRSTGQRTRVFATLTSALVLLASAPSAAAWRSSTLALEPVIGEAPGEQRMPSAAFDAGVFFVVWEDQRHLRADRMAARSVYGTRVSLEGEVLDPLGIVIERHAASMPAAQVTSCGGGAFLVSWNAFDSKAGAPNIALYRRYGAKGRPLDRTARPLLPAKASAQQRVVACSGRRALVAWTTSAREVRIADLDLVSGKHSSAQGVVAHHDAARFPTALDLGWDGGAFVLAWRASSGSHHTPDAVRALSIPSVKRASAKRRPFGVVELATGNISAGPLIAAHVRPNGEGETRVLFEQHHDTNEKTGFSVRLRAGQAAAAPEVVRAPGATVVDVSYDGSGFSALLSRPSQEALELMPLEREARPTEVFSEPLGPQPPHIQSGAALAAGGGRVLVAWADASRSLKRSPGESYTPAEGDVHLRVFANGAPSGPVTSLTSGHVERRWPKVAGWDGAGVVIWSEGASGEVLAARIDVASGKLLDPHGQLVGVSERDSAVRGYFAVVHGKGAAVIALRSERGLVVRALYSDGSLGDELLVDPLGRNPQLAFDGEDLWLAYLASAAPTIRVARLIPNAGRLELVVPDERLSRAPLVSAHDAVHALALVCRAAGECLLGFRGGRESVAYVTRLSDDDGALTLSPVFTDGSPAILELAALEDGYLSAAIHHPAAGVGVRWLTDVPGVSTSPLCLGCGRGKASSSTRAFAWAQRPALSPWPGGAVVVWGEWDEKRAAGSRLLITELAARGRVRSPKALTAGSHPDAVAVGFGTVLLAFEDDDGVGLRLLQRR